MSSYKDILLEAKNILLTAGIDDKHAKTDAEEILLYITRLKKNDLITKQNEEITDINKNIFFQSIKDRSKHKPLAYIIHSACFFGYTFFVNESCLIPRIDSEALVEQVLEYIKSLVKSYAKQHISILDACCGSGCLGISTVKSLIKDNVLPENNINLTLLDKSSSAIQVAKVNLQTHSIKAKLVVSDVLLAGFGNQQYDIIICNPPYIETETIKTLDDEVKNFEPHQALDGGADGLIFYKTISKFLSTNLSQHGKAFFEIGYNQGKTAKEIFEAQNFTTNIVKDYGKQDRVLIVKTRNIEFKKT